MTIGTGSVWSLEVPRITSKLILTILSKISYFKKKLKSFFFRRKSIFEFLFFTNADNI